MNDGRLWDVCNNNNRDNFSEENSEILHVCNSNNRNNFSEENFEILLVQTYR